MEYFVGNLIAEDDVRAVPLGGKRKRGRPKRNPHCLTRSPGQGDTAYEDIVPSVNMAEEEALDIDYVQSFNPDTPEELQPANNEESMSVPQVNCHTASGEVLASNAIAVEHQSNVGEILPGDVGCASGVGTEDLCLQLEDSCSNSSDDMNIISADPAFNFKPPKKVKRDVREVLLAFKGRGRGKRGRAKAGAGNSPPRRGRGRPPLRSKTTDDLGRPSTIPVRRGRGRPPFESATTAQLSKS